MYAIGDIRRKLAEKLKDNLVSMSVNIFNDLLLKDKIKNRTFCKDKVLLEIRNCLYEEIDRFAILYDKELRESGIKLGLTGDFKEKLQRIVDIVVYVLDRDKAYKQVAFAFLYRAVKIAEQLKRGGRVES